MTSNAFLWAYLIRQDGSSQPIDLTELPYTPQENEYLWLHLQTDVEDAQALLEKIELNAAIIDAITAPETRPRAMPLDQGALVYLRAINKNPDADPDDMVSLRVLVGERIIITGRRKLRSLMSIHDMRQRVVEGDAPISPTELLLQTFDFIADRIHDTVDEMDDRLVEFETATSLSKQNRLALASLRRQAATIRRYLAPQRDALDALFRIQGLLSDTQAFALREQADRMARYVEDLDLLRERAIVLQDELRNQLADQQGMRMYVLSMVTAIFLPLSFLTGVFGMNVGGLPGTESSDAFTILMGSMGVLAIVMLIAMLWRRWL